jgi:hypothetical protein
MPEKALKLTLYNTLRTAMINPEVRPGVNFVLCRKERAQAGKICFSVGIIIAPAALITHLSTPQTGHVTHAKEALAGVDFVV